MRKIENWLEVAKRLRYNAKVRSACSDGCGQDNSQIISHGQRGFSRHCFRCGSSEFVPHGIRKISEIVAIRQARGELVDIELPDEYTTDVPVQLAVWYFKYGISDDLAKKYGIGYDPSSHRIILPVWEDGILTAYNARATIEGQFPKYINQEGGAVGSALFYADLSFPESKSTVLTEDYLSAVKISTVHHATSMLGTTLTDARAVKLANKFDTVYIWLDSDKAGMNGALKAARKLRMLGVNVERIQTENDPKTYSREYIENILRGFI